MMAPDDRVELVKNKYNDFIAKLDSNWNEVCESNLALCIGAGVTQNYVGNWNELLKKLMILRVGDTLSHQWEKDSIDHEGDIQRLENYLNNKYESFSNNINVLEQGEYLMEDDYDFEESDISTVNTNQNWMEKFFAQQVHHVIDHNINQRANNNLSKDFIARYEDGKLSTLRHVLGICLSSQVEYVINYNFDTILENLLNDENVCKKIEPCKDKWPNIEVFAYSDDKIDIENLIKRKPIELENTPNRRTLRIYHVHGIARDVTSDSMDAFQPLIFSENSYLEYQRNLLSWSQRRILDVMHSSNLLCIGFSGTDPNFRYLARLLNSQHKNEYNFDNKEKRPDKKIWLTQKLPDTFMCDIENGDPYAFACLDMLTKSTSRYFIKHFSATILWMENYEKLACELEKIYT
ncbi:MAG: SIR2 family protein [Oscillospiraceae bacterium]|nr:SIR2 family protein [Oscillospiraceae bacterium]